jgi:diguanylate cyclase (GGDEF)-like protein
VSTSTNHSLASNAALLKSKASKYAYYGVVIALVAIVVATALVSVYNTGGISLDALIEAQRDNKALWLLDLMPFAFAFWGQYVSSMIAYEAGALVVDQTSELRAQTTAIEQQAMHDLTHDKLTDLPNRALLRDRLEQAVSAAAHERSQLAILVLDLDRFKEINDTLGHYNGDRLLKQVALRLEGAVKETDTVARLGGDEFAVLLHRISSPDDATDLGRKIGKALQAPFGLEGLKLDVQASIGIAVFPDHGPDADTLLQRADVAMYIAKQQKSGCVSYDPKLDKHSPRRLTLMGELRHAIDADELVLHYQPKIDLGSGTIVEAEALVRWQHPQYGMLGPDEFIPLAERTGLIKPLTIWVLGRALRQQECWREQGIDIGVAVNMSAHGLFDLELPDLVAGLLAAHGTLPERLMLEITETSIMVDQQRALDILSRLADMGVRLSIDDFGTGYSSLAYLSKLPVDEIKIDRSFVMDMMENGKHAMIVRATIDLAHNLDLEVVGEGTCKPEILAHLRELGCDAAQGNHISPAVDVASFSRWLESSEWEPRRSNPENSGSEQLGWPGRAKPKAAASHTDIESIESAIQDLEDFVRQADPKPDGSKAAGAS